jgi:hypothetical protein
MKQMTTILLPLLVSGCMAVQYQIDHRFDGMTITQFVDAYGQPDWPPAPTNVVVRDYNSHCIFITNGVIRESVYKINDAIYRVYWMQDTNWTWRVHKAEKQI